ncbi:hypothetical protein KCU68_g25, partial [Aureobasidium melanogenum]
MGTSGIKTLTHCLFLFSRSYCPPSSLFMHLAMLLHMHVAEAALYRRFPLSRPRVSTLRPHLDTTGAPAT